MDCSRGGVTGLVLKLALGAVALHRLRLRRRAELGQDRGLAGEVRAADGAAAGRVVVAGAGVARVCGREDEMVAGGRGAKRSSGSRA